MDDVKPSQFLDQTKNLERNIAGFRFDGQELTDILSPGLFSPINLVFYVIGIYFLINTVSAGLTMMTSGGEPAKIGSAKAKITNSIIGFLVAFSAYWIVQILLIALKLNNLGTFTT